jgi:hypothetical protein
LNTMIKEESVSEEGRCVVKGLGNIPDASNGAQSSSPLPSLPALAVRPSLWTYWSFVVIPI